MEASTSANTSRAKIRRNHRSEISDPMMQRSNKTPSFFCYDEQDTPRQQIKPPPDPNRKQRRAQSKKKDFIPYQLPVACKEETRFRHEHWEFKRGLVMQTLPKAGVSLGAQEAFRECGAQAVVEYCSAEQKYRVRGSYCHNRHCEPCQKAKANRMAANLRDRLADRKQYQYRFVTLTLKHTDKGLREQIDHLYASFKKLRNSKLWKNSQKGGCAILEVKYNRDRGDWHPHLHLIAEGDHMHKERLSDEWLKATGDSYVVDIKLLSNDADAAYYVAKYIGKGSNDEIWCNEGASIEWITAMKGTRSAATYGSWRGFALLKINEEKREWRSVGTLYRIYEDAEQGHVYAIKILDNIRRDLQYNPHRPRTKKEVKNE